MAFVVEDETGVDDANSYVTVEFADTYFSTQMDQVWESLSSEAKQAALVQATTYTDLRWANMAGKPLTETQALVFPRTDLPACAKGKVLPDRLKYAVCEYAIRASQANLLKDLDHSSTGYAIQRKLEKVGPITEDTSFSVGQLGGISERQVFPVYSLPDTMMQCLVSPVSKGGVIRY